MKPPTLRPHPPDAPLRPGAEYLCFEARFGSWDVWTATHERYLTWRGRTEPVGSGLFDVICEIVEQRNAVEDAESGGVAP